jgi:hypothetical protein
MPPKSAAAANVLRSPVQAASAIPGQTSHPSGGAFAPNQSIFTPVPAPLSEEARARAVIEDLSSQLAALQDTVRVLAEDKRQQNPKHQDLIPPTPTSFLSFVQSSSPRLTSFEGESYISRLDGGARGGSMSRNSSRGTHFSAGDLREILNPRKQLEEPRLQTINVAAAVDFLTKWHEHGASVLGTSTATHLSLLISPPALQTIADKNDIAPDSISSACNSEIIGFIAKAISHGKGPADALLCIASHCSFRRLTASAFASFYIRFEILCFLFAPTSIPDKTLAKAFCSSIQSTRASLHLASLESRDWRSLAQILKNAILQREALEPFFGPHKDPEVTSRADGFREPHAIRNAPVSPQSPPAFRNAPSSAQTPSSAAPLPPRTQSQQPSQRPQTQPYSGPSRQSFPSPHPSGSSVRFQPRSVAAHAAHISADPDPGEPEPEVDETDLPFSDGDIDE